SSTQNAPQKARPGRGDGRTAAEEKNRPPIDSVCFGEALEIGKQGAEGDQILESTTCRGDATAHSEHRVELPTACLIDSQRLALDFLVRPTHRRCTREVTSCVVEAMRRRGDFGVNKGGSK